MNPTGRPDRGESSHLPHSRGSQTPGRTSSRPHQPTHRPVDDRRLSTLPSGRIDESPGVGPPIAVVDRSVGTPLVSRPAGDRSSSITNYEVNFLDDAGPCGLDSDELEGVLAHERRTVTPRQRTTEPGLSRSVSEIIYHGHPVSSPSDVDSTTASILSEYSEAASTCSLMANTTARFGQLAAGAEPRPAHTAVANLRRSDSIPETGMRNPGSVTHPA